MTSSLDSILLKIEEDLEEGVKRTFELTLDHLKHNPELQKEFAETFMLIKSYRYVANTFLRGMLSLKDKELGINISDEGVKKYIEIARTFANKILNDKYVVNALGIFLEDISEAVYEGVFEKIIFSKKLKDLFDVLVKAYRKGNVFPELIKNSMFAAKIGKFEEYVEIVKTLFEKEEYKRDNLNEDEVKIWDRSATSSFIDLTPDAVESGTFDKLIEVTKKLSENILATKIFLYNTSKIYYPLDEYFTKLNDKTLDTLVKLVEKNVVAADVFAKHLPDAIEAETIEIYSSKKEFLDVLVEMANSGDEQDVESFVKGATVALKDDALFNKYLRIFKTLKDKHTFLAEMFAQGTPSAIYEKIFDKYCGYYSDEKFLNSLLRLYERDNIVATIAALYISDVVKLNRVKRYIEAITRYIDHLASFSEIGRIITSIAREEESLDYLLNTKDHPRIALGKILLKKFVKDEFGVETDLNNLDQALEIVEEKIGLNLGQCTILEKINIMAAYTNLEEEEREILKRLLKLLPNYWEDEKIKEILSEMKKAGINIEALKPRVLGIYSLKKGDNGKIEKVKYEDLVKAFVYTLTGSRDPKNVEWGYSLLKNVFGENKAKSAKGFYKSLSKEYKKKYRLLPGEIGKLLRKGNYVEIMRRYENLVNELSQEYSKKGKKILGLEFLSDIINSIEGKKKYSSRIVQGKNVVVFIDKNPSMMFSNQSTGSCSELPTGENRFGTVLYKLDPRVVEIGIARINVNNTIDNLIRYVRENRGELDGKVIGYIAMTEDGRKVLLIDSVEVGPSLYFPGEDKWFNKGWKNIDEIIQNFARELDVDLIVYNTSVTNNASKYFLEKIRETYNLSEEEIRLKIIGTKEIPYTKILYNEDMMYLKENHYLEAFGGWKVPEGVVKGCVLPTTYQVTYQITNKIKNCLKDAYIENKNNHSIFAKLSNRILNYFRRFSFLPF